MNADDARKLTIDSKLDVILAAIAVQAKAGKRYLELFQWDDTPGDHETYVSFVYNADTLSQLTAKGFRVEAHTQRAHLLSSIRVPSGFHTIHW